MKIPTSKFTLLDDNGSKLVTIEGVLSLTFSSPVIKVTVGDELQPKFMSQTEAANLVATFNK